MRSVFDFLIGCARVPSFSLSIFFLYVKFLKYAKDHLGIVYVNIFDRPLELFFYFINFLYKYVFFAPVEYIFFAIAFLTNLFGFSFDFKFPIWYATAAYVSTIIYGAQGASMKLFGPIAEYAMDDEEKEAWNKEKNEIAEWSRSLLATIHHITLIIYIPINGIAKRIEGALPQENLSGKRVSRVFKIVILGFFMVGYLFLIYDLILMVLHWNSKMEAIRKHKLFHAALTTSFVGAIALTYLTVVYFTEM